MTVYSWKDTVKMSHKVSGICLVVFLAALTVSHGFPNAAEWGMPIPVRSTSQLFFNPGALPPPQTGLGSSLPRIPSNIVAASPQPSISNNGSSNQPAVNQNTNPGAQPAVNQNANTGSPPIVKQNANSGGSSAVSKTTSVGSQRAVNQVADVGSQSASSQNASMGGQSTIIQNTNIGSQSTVNQNANLGSQSTVMRTQSTVNQNANSGSQWTVKQITTSGGKTTVNQNSNSGSQNQNTNTGGFLNLNVYTERRVNGIVNTGHIVNPMSHPQALASFIGNSGGTVNSNSLIPVRQSSTTVNRNSLFPAQQFTRSTNSLTGFHANPTHQAVAVDFSRLTSNPPTYPEISNLLSIAETNPSQRMAVINFVNKILRRPSTQPAQLRPSTQLPLPGSGGRLLCYAGSDSCFSYNPNSPIGPSCWYAIDGVRNRCCDEGGSFQSPINLPHSGNVVDHNTYLYYNIPHEYAIEGMLENNGIYPRWRPVGETVALIGVFPGRNVNYILDNINIHFGSLTDVRQSEHLIDNRSFNAEVHIVHYDGKYPNLAVASQYPNGILIMALPLSVMDGEENDGMKEFVEKINSVPQFTETATVCLPESVRVRFHNLVGIPESRGPQCHASNTEGVFPNYCQLHSYGSRPCGMAVNGAKIYPNIMLPKKPEFYSYTGSMTTPPCSESVYWLVAENPAKIQRNIIRDMRTIQSRLGNDLIAKYGNLRPLQRQRQRVVTRMKYKGF